MEQGDKWGFTFKLKSAFSRPDMMGQVARSVIVKELVEKVLVCRSWFLQLQPCLHPESFVTLFGRGGTRLYTVAEN